MADRLYIDGTGSCSVTDRDCAVDLKNGRPDLTPGVR